MGSPFCGHGPSNAHANLSRQEREQDIRLYHPTALEKQGRAQRVSQKNRPTALERLGRQGLDPNTLTQPDSVQKKHRNQTLRRSVTGDWSPVMQRLQYRRFNENSLKKLRAALHTTHTLLIRLTFVNRRASPPFQRNGIGIIPSSTKEQPGTLSRP